MTKLARETRREFVKSLQDCAEMPSWNQLDLFLTGTYKELTSVDDVPESKPYPYPKPKQFSDNKHHHVPQCNPRAYERQSFAQKASKGTKFHLPYPGPPKTRWLNLQTLQK